MRVATNLVITSHGRFGEEVSVKSLTTGQPIEVPQYINKWVNPEIDYLDLPPGIYEIRRRKWNGTKCEDTVEVIKIDPVAP